MAAVALCWKLGGLALQQLHAEVLQLSSSHSARHGDWMAASDSARRALLIAPQQSRYLEQAAYVEENLDRPEHAHQLLLRFVEQRPGSAYAWGRLARWELDHGADDSKPLQLSLRQVSSLGPHERGIRKALAQEALQHWDAAFPAEVRATLREALRLEYLERPHNVGGYAFAQHKETVLCRVLGQEPGMGQLPGWCKVVAYVRSSCETGMPMTAGQSRWCEQQTALWTGMNYPGE